MNQLLQNSRTGEFSLVNVPAPAVRPEGVLVRTAFSLISPGTEKNSVSTAQASLLGKAKSRPDLVRQVMQYAQSNGAVQTYKLVKDRLDAPMQLGYACAGVVVACGYSVPTLQVGDRVACAGAGFASHAEINYVPINLVVKLPDRVAFAKGAYTTLGAIALQGVRQSGAVVGDKVAVIGLGLIGQLTVQILKAAGCHVVGVDISDFAIQLAKEKNGPIGGNGHSPADSESSAKNPQHKWAADLVLNSSTQDVHQNVSKFTAGYGVDRVIITAAAKDNRPLLLAGDIIRDRGTIVVVGAVPVDIPRSPFYEKEVDIKFSRSYGPGRYDPEYEEKGLDYPIGYVRWTENRNMEAFLQLVKEGKVNVDHLTTHTFELKNAPKAYQMIMEGTEPYMGILIDYDYSGAVEKNNGQTESKSHAQPTASNKPVLDAASPTIGFLGLGKFAQTFLLPNIKKDGAVGLQTIVNSSGVSADRAMSKNNFRQCSTDPGAVLEDVSINTVFIASRHNSHAQYVLQALEHGKHVFVEKPLCLTREELLDIRDAYSESDSTEPTSLAPLLMVGYNRRFAPLSAALTKDLKTRTRPLSILYRVNAGLIDRKHWIQDPEIGGGRIIGEVCHFIDYALFLTGARVVSVYATSARYDRVDIPNEDSISINLTFADGSIATIHYICDGDRSVAKEWIEVMVDGMTYQIDDFRVGFMYRGGKRKKILGSSRKQNKGYTGEITAFFDAIRKGGPAPITASEIFHGMDVTFLVRESLANGQVLRVGQSVTEALNT